MKKVIVIGCPGSGKSTFSVKLHEATGIPLIHLDMLYWKEDKTTVEKTEFIEKLQCAMKESRWIIDGNYSTTMEMRLQACDTVFFLDYDADTCLEGVRHRRGKVRTDLPWIETEEDEEFLTFIRNYGTEYRPQVMDLLKKYGAKNIFVFQTREESENFICGLQEAFS